MRLPTIFILMALVLLSGVVSVRVLETRMGGATVPGLVVIDAEGLGLQDLEAVQARFPGMLLESLPAGPQALAPFDSTLIGKLRGRGDFTALYTLVDRREGSLDPALWNKRRTSFPRPELSAVVEEGAVFLASQDSTRSFFLALVLGPDSSTDGMAPMRELRAAAAELPAFRRCAILLLGARRDDLPGQRWVLRLDTGRWVQPAEPGSADLLKARW